MSSAWALSDKFTKFLDELIASSDFSSTASDYYPSVGWSLGGSMQGPDGTITPIPPRYEVGLIKKGELDHFGTALPNTRFGYVAFLAKPEDSASPRRLIDYDGKEIVVR